MGISHRSQTFPQLASDAHENWPYTDQQKNSFESASLHYYTMHFCQSISLILVKHTVHSDLGKFVLTNWEEVITTALNLIGQDGHATKRNDLHLQNDE